VRLRVVSEKKNGKGSMEEVEKEKGVEGDGG